jgi:hypothetical protein
VAEIVEFKSGKDLDEARSDEEDNVTCASCGTEASDETAYAGGWQLAPPVCPNCLRWTATEGCDCAVAAVHDGSGGGQERRLG